MASTKILVPDMGDFKDVEVIEVLVKEGQQIKKNDSLITLEKIITNLLKIIKKLINYQLIKKLELVIFLESFTSIHVSY